MSAHAPQDPDPMPQDRDLRPQDRVPMPQDPDLVDIALALDRLSTHYRVQMTPNQARRFVLRADAYNAFTPEGLARLLADIDRALPPMRLGEGNPNDGLPAHHYLVGNENSRVIYVRYVTSHTPAGFEFDRLAAELERRGREAGAGECDAHHGPTLFTFRLWWD